MYYSKNSERARILLVQEHKTEENPINVTFILSILETMIFFYKTYQNNT